MATEFRRPRFAWQPFTFQGVADLASVRAKRVLLIALFVSLGISALVIFLAFSRWTPVIDQAIEQLPLEGVIAEGRLQTPLTDPVILAEGTFFSIILDPALEETFGPLSDIQCEIGLTETRLRSFFGYVVIPYQPRWVLSFNRADLQPLWGAWKFPLLAGLGAAVFVSLWVSWLFLATLYTIPARLIAFYTRREAPGLTSWKLSLAALMPGAVMLGAAIFVYLSYHLPLGALIVLWVAHLPLGWFYLAMSPISLPLRGQWPQPESDPDEALATAPLTVQDMAPKPAPKPPKSDTPPAAPEKRKAAPKGAGKKQARAKNPFEDRAGLAASPNPFQEPTIVAEGEEEPDDEDEGEDDEKEEDA